MMRKPGFLLVANYDSAVGYAWWLMESFWGVLAQRYSGSERVLLAYPSISTLPTVIANAPLKPVVLDFNQRGIIATLRQLVFLRREHIRTIYLTDWPGVSWRYAVYRLAGVRTIIVHDHTPGSRSAPRGLKRYIKRVLANFEHIAATGLIGATGYVSERHWRVNCFPREHCFIAENGLPSVRESTPINLADRFGIPPGRRVVVSVGRLAPIKGGEIALRAVQLLRTEFGLTDVHYLHIGDGPELGRLLRLASDLGLADCTSYPGAIRDIPAVLRSCAVAIHPSFAEVGYSLSILESMQAGLPVVVSDTESVRGATRTGQTGLVFESGNARAAAAALVSILCDEKRRQEMGRAAALDVSERFALANTHRMLLDAVEQIRSRSVPRSQG